MLRKWLICILVFTCCLNCYAERLVIAFEPFPPFINEDGEGLTANMLREIEAISNFTFDIKIMTYARAKHELEHQRIDIAGHTPKDIETAEFYQYAIELDWQIKTTSDLFSLEAKHISLEQIKHQKI